MGHCQLEHSASTHTHTRAHAHTRACTHARMHTRAHAHTRACTHARMHTRAHAHTRACTHARMHTRAHAHARAHAFYRTMYNINYCFVTVIGSTRLRGRQHRTFVSFLVAGCVLNVLRGCPSKKGSISFVPEITKYTNLLPPPPPPPSPHSSPTPPVS